MTRMTGPDCAVMCNLINTHTHTHKHLPAAWRASRSSGFAACSPRRSLQTGELPPGGHRPCERAIPRRSLVLRCQHPKKLTNLHDRVGRVEQFLPLGGRGGEGDSRGSHYLCHRKKRKRGNFQASQLQQNECHERVGDPCSPSNPQACDSQVRKRVNAWPVKKPISRASIRY